MGKKLNFNYKRILLFILATIAAIIGIYLGIELAVFYFPFLIAYVIYKVVKKPIEFLNKKLKFPRGLAAILSIILFIAIVGSILYAIFAIIIKELISLSQDFSYLLPEMYTNITTLVSRFLYFFSQLNLSEQIITSIQTSFFTVTDKILTALGDALNATVNFLINTVVSLPQLLIYIIIAILATFFICSDSDYIRESIEKHVPKKWMTKLYNIVNGLIKSLGGYLKAQCIMITITFFELFIFFSVYGMKYSLILAITIALIDALPILGTGTVLIPWSIFNLALGNIKLAVFLIILYLFVLVVRQLIEPRVVASQIGVYPLLTLLAMYTGVKLIGLVGVIVGPIVLIVIKNVLEQFYKQGTLKDVFENTKSL